MHWITVVLFIVGEAVADEAFSGPCPAAEPVSNLNLTALLGTWYEAERYNNIFEFEGKCVTVNFSPTIDGSVQIVNRQISSETNKVTTIIGIANQIGDRSSGNFMVTYPSLPDAPRAPYLILGTNQYDWVVVWSCSDDPTYSFRYAWLLTKKQKPSPGVFQAAYRVWTKYNIDTTYFLRTDQKNCPKTH